MTQRIDKPLPPRKEPGLLSYIFTGIVGLIFWLIFSLMLSIAIEWVGIAFFWEAQGHQHALTLLADERQYINQHLQQVSSNIDIAIDQITQGIIEWIAQDAGINSLIHWLASPLRLQEGKLSQWGYSLYVHYQSYLLAVPAILQLFFVRIALIVFSLPALLLFAVVGVVDGLVERDLRRWGGGRESSNLYNLARKSVFPTFILACVLYLSSPVTLHPAWIIIPFAGLWGLSIRITFSRLKKYF